MIELTGAVLAVGAPPLVEEFAITDAAADRACVRRHRLGGDRRQLGDPGKFSTPLPTTPTTKSFSTLVSTTETAFSRASGSLSRSGTGGWRRRLSRSIAGLRRSWPRNCRRGL